jgi:hypothetical protein
VTHSFEFRQTGKGLGDVVVDGHDIGNLVSDFTVEHSANKPATVTLSLVPRLLMLALSPERVELDGPTTAFLKALGWRYAGVPDGRAQDPDADEIKRLRAIEQRADAARRRTATESDEYEQGWLDACTEVLQGVTS